MSNIEIALTCNWPRNISQAIGWRGGRLKLSARSADSLSARIEALQSSRGQAVRAPGLGGLADSFNRTPAQRLERATGIEPAWPAWKAGTLPLSYARNDTPS